MKQIKYLLFILLIMLISCGQVHAKDLEWIISSNSKIGGKKIGSSTNFIEIYNNTYNSIAIDIQLDYISSIGYQTSPYNQGDLVPFVFTSCTDANTPISGIHSSYENILDLNYISDEKCSFSWDSNTQSGNIQYTFVKLKLNTLYADDVESETNPLEIWHYKFNGQALGISNYVGWQSAIWFMNIDYLDEASYNTMLANYRELKNQKDTNNKLDTQINQNQEIINQNNQAENTRNGIWDTIKSMLNYLNPFSEDFFAYKLVELILNMLKSLFIPEDMDFVTNFVEALESKLGFIAAIPVKIIEFTMSLATATWSEFNSIQLPSISIFGYNFWNAQEIDLTEAINIFKPFKYVTDVICVVICAQTLNKWREKFTGGGVGK